MKRKVPPALLIYAALLPGAALDAFRRAYAPVASTAEIVLDMLEAALTMLLAIGILRLWRSAWIAAIVYCWLFFIVFAVVLLFWCISPHDMSLVETVVLAAATAIHVYIYVVLRRDEVRAIFHRPAVDANA